MKKATIIFISLLMVLVISSSVGAKTSLTASFKTHKINVSDDKAQELVDMVSSSFMGDLTDLMINELTDDVIKELLKLIDEDLMKLLQEDKYSELDPNNGDKIPDLINDLIGLINKEIAGNDTLIQDAKDSLGPVIIRELKVYNVENPLYVKIGSWEPMGPKYYYPFANNAENLTNNTLLPIIGTTLEGILQNELPDLMNQILPSIAATVIDEVPRLLEDMVKQEIPGLFAELVNDEIPYLAEKLVFKYLPRNFTINVASLDLKTDINDYFAVGVGLKGIGVLNVFMPEVSVSTYLKLINEPKFDMGIMLLGQALFLPKMDDIYALNAGLFFNYQISNSFYLEGELMVGTFISEPFGIGDSIPIVGGYNFGLVFDVTEHMHIKAGYSVHGFSELAVTGLKYFLMDEIEVGTFSLSVGCHF